MIIPYILILLSSFSSNILSQKCNSTTHYEPYESYGSTVNQNQDPITHTVNVGNGLIFSPESLVINKGDSVDFVFISGLHNVMETEDSVTCIAKSGGFSSQTLSSGNFKQQFNDVGTKYYTCTIGNHCESGMKGKITVNESNESNGINGINESTHDIQFYKTLYVLCVLSIIYQL